MDESRSEKSGKTLGQWLWSLRPGDACVCCGAELRSSEPVEQVRPGWLHRMSPAGRSPGAPGELVCPECGCEVTVEAAPNASTCGRTLSPAA